MSASSDIPHHVLTRPKTAHGTFLRILQINDVYKLENYANFAAASNAARSASQDLDCVVKSFLVGDFLSPSILTALDNGKALLKGLNLSTVEYVCLGNHEFDIGLESLDNRLKDFQGTVINSNADGPDFLTQYPKHCIVDIGERKAVLGAFLTDQMDIYPPNARPALRPIDDCCVSTWEAAKEECLKSAAGKVPDLFLPMTHQLMHQDRDTAVFLAKHQELSERTPIILGGHDHEVYVEEVGNSMITKMGVDGEKIGVIDIWWTESGERKTSISVLPCEEFPREPKAEAFAVEKAKGLERAMSLPIMELKQTGSTKKVRFEESYIAKFLLKYLKYSLFDRKVDVAMIQAGAVRASADYEPGDFILGDLFKEFAFDLPIGVVDVPGSIIAESVHNTRIAAKPAPQFLHLDEDCEVAIDDDGKHVVTQLNGAPIIPDKIYRVATWNNTLNGVNDIEPLLSYVRSKNIVPDDEVCLGAKELIVKYCMKDAWRHLFELEGHDLEITVEDATQAVENTFEKIDEDGNGLVDVGELCKYIKKEGGNGPSIGLMRRARSSILAIKMMEVVDFDRDGMVSSKDLNEFVCK
mmetsp:Transcript_36129/g.66246  ORF Transcript_36129/g.66246 Transcript_36129/m.66246 type:complete len:582 (-) Transcript_36129:79-1824(-)